MTTPFIPGAKPAVRSFRPGDLPKVRELFAAGMLEFAGDLEPQFRRYIEESLSDDLSDVSEHYLADSNGHFWVADLAGALVGMVGIQPTDDVHVAELRRMSVSAKVRRRGIGRTLLETSEGFCRERGYRRIHLASTTVLQPALEMYRNSGYVLTKVEPYGAPGDRHAVTVHHMVKEL